MKFLFFIFDYLFFFSIASSQPILYLPLDHWAYPYLDRFSGLHYIELDLEVRPVLRSEVLGEIRPILESVERGEVILSPIDRWYLERLRVEFQRELGVKPQKIADRPLFEFEEGESYFTFDTRISGARLIQKRESPSRVGSLDFRSYGTFGDKIAYDEKIVLSNRKGEGVRELGFSDAGLVPWNDFWTSIERSYFAMGVGAIHELPLLQIQIGRDRKWWGPGRFGTLFLSTNAPPIDLLQLSSRIWRFHAGAFTALLSPDEGRFLSIHRLGFHLSKRTTLGVAEGVFYNRRLPELGYLNPILPYYATQRNVDKDDNIFWHLDFSTLPKDGIKVYGELLIDDFQYSERDSFPDKLGGLIGFQWFNPLGIRDTDLQGEVGRIQKWVYTHRKSDNSYLHEEELLGDGIGPDAERIHLLLTKRWTKRLSTILKGVSIRHGEGRDFVPWELNYPDPRPPFPSGIVERRSSIGLGMDFEPTWRVRFNLFGRWETWKNEWNIEGEDSEDFLAETRVEINF